MITENAPAKINLALHVRARRADGYHELETLFAFVEHGDTVTLAPGQLSLTITGPFGVGLSGEGDNLVLRAARAFAAAYGLPEAGAFTLDKHLPVASGIGGGSADAAAALRALARANAVPIDDSWLFEIAAALGSDIPACLLGRTAMGQGRGERLAPLDGPVGMPALLVNPGVAVSTAAVFKAWDGVDRGAMPEGDVLAMVLAGRNDLEAPARMLAPEIDAVLAMLGETSADPTCSPAKAGAQPWNDGNHAQRLLSTGSLLSPGLRRGTAVEQGRAQSAPILARMSGSGATCFALYQTEAARSATAARIKAAHPDWWCLETRLA